jgi:hypothetical protein
MRRGATVLLMACAAVVECRDASAGSSARAQGTAMTVDGVSVGADGMLRIDGTVASLPAPASFRLRTGLGCARDARLGAATTGHSFAVAMSAEDLGDAFACAIDVAAGDEALPMITLTPGAEAEAEVDNDDDAGLVLEPTFAIVAASLDPAAGRLVRFTVAVSDGASDGVDDARITLGATTYGATIAPSEEGRDVASTAVFDVPARAWANAVVTNAPAYVDMKMYGGRHRTLTLHPTARRGTLDTSDTLDH